MDTILEIIHITLVAIAHAIFNFSYVFVMGLVYFFIKKVSSANVYNLENAKSPIMVLIEAAIQGILVGVLGCLVMISLGLSINNTWYIFLLFPISVGLSLINFRYICFSYSATVMGFMALVFNGQRLWGITLPSINVNVTSLIALVGVLHLMESVLIFFVGAKDCIPVISKRNDTVILGHILQKYWPLPIAFLILTEGTVSTDIIEMPIWWPLINDVSLLAGSFYFSLTPIVGALGYSSVSFTERPEKRAKKTALLLFAYSIIIITLSVIADDNRILTVIDLVLMASIHEGIILYEKWFEKRGEPVFPVPSKGVRIMYVLEKGAADIMGMQRGDIIKSINNIEIEDFKHFRTVMKNKYTFLWIEIINYKGDIITKEYKAYPNGLATLGIKVVPEKPKIIFREDHIKGIGLYQLLKNRLNRE
jgi:hypothetical protein